MLDGSEVGRIAFHRHIPRQTNPIPDFNWLCTLCRCEHYTNFDSHYNSDIHCNLLAVGIGHCDRTLRNST